MWINSFRYSDFDFPEFTPLVWFQITQVSGLQLNSPVSCRCNHTWGLFQLFLAVSFPGVAQGFIPTYISRLVRASLKHLLFSCPNSYIWSPITLNQWMLPLVKALMFNQQESLASLRSRAFPGCGFNIRVDNYGYISFRLREEPCRRAVQLGGRGAAARNRGTHLPGRYRAPLTSNNLLLGIHERRSSNGNIYINLIMLIEIMH